MLHVVHVQVLRQAVASLHGQLRQVQVERPQVLAPLNAGCYVTKMARAVVRESLCEGGAGEGGEGRLPPPVDSWSKNVKSRQYLGVPAAAAVSSGSTPPFRT